MKTALVTGAGGFIGTALCRELTEAGWRVAGCVRSSEALLPEGVVPLVVKDLAELDSSRPTAGLAEVDVVFHLAGRAHRSDELGSESSATDYLADNLEATRRVHAWACELGAGHLIALSTIKVLGDTSTTPLTPELPYQPEDVYARSKVAGEEFLLRVGTRAGPAISILRPPLVYGPGVKGNFARLLELIDSPWPLPLGAACAPRSMLALPNLVDLLVRIGLQPLPFPAGLRKSQSQSHVENSPRIYHAKDDQEMSVSELVRVLSELLGNRKILLPVPPTLMAGAARVLGQYPVYERLFLPMQVDDTQMRKALHWTPPVAAKDALSVCAEAWQAARGTEG